MRRNQILISHLSALVLNSALNPSISPLNSSLNPAISVSTWFNRLSIWLRMPSILATLSSNPAPFTATYYTTSLSGSQLEKEAGPEIEV